MAIKIYLGYPPENIVNWIKAEVERKKQEKLKAPLCFTAEEAGSTIKMYKYEDEPIGAVPTVYLETSPTGEEGSWTDFTVCTFNSENWAANDDGTIITLANVGDKVYFRAKQDNERFGKMIGERGFDSGMMENHNYGGTWHCNQFSMTGKIAASGNINTLLKADGSVLDLTGRDYCYFCLFFGCSSLTQAPELPATTLAEGCYDCMFYDCTSLTKAPELPATTLADYCYFSMFEECHALTQAPLLLATTLAKCCYGQMFWQCTSLTQAPELPATTLADYCYYKMFENCYVLTQAPSILPATTLADRCYYAMFMNCTSLTQSPELLAETLSYMHVEYMFEKCKSPFTFPNKTFDEVVDLIQNQCIFIYQWDVNPIEIICSDKTMIATFDNYLWTLTEK